MYVGSRRIHHGQSTGDAKLLVKTEPTTVMADGGGVFVCSFLMPIGDCSHIMVGDKVVAVKILVESMGMMKVKNSPSAE
jgi:hypothetical protein